MAKKAVKPLSVDRFFIMYTPGSEIEHPEFEKLLIAYGQAMWSWSRVENNLFAIFSQAIAPTTTSHQKALRAAFFSIVAAKNRLDMLSSVTKEMWKGQGYWDDWLALLDECRSAQRTRGRLAHLVGYGFYIQKPNAQRDEIFAVLGEPQNHPTAPRNHSDLKRGEFDADSLANHARVWGSLNSRLMLFAQHVQEAQRGASSQPPANLRRLLRPPPSQTRTARPKPPKPSRQKP